MDMVRVAIVGFGGIARTHYKSYNKLIEQGVPVKLVAVCDVDPERFVRKIGINLADDKNNALTDDIRKYTNADELLKNEEFDMVDICLPTYLHKEYAIKFMRAGKHVLSEKPMALSTADCEEMIDVHNETGKRFMVAQCIRFWPAYTYIKECIEKGTFGKIRHIFMERISAMPRWSFENWYEDTDKSGGAILDLHLHDVDVVRYLLGDPYAVSATAQDTKVRWSIVNTRMLYDDVMVSIMGSWGESNTSKFKMAYRVRFEKASIVFEAGVATVYPDEGEPYVLDLPKDDGYVEEVRYMVDLILHPEKENDICTPESTCKSVRTIEKLRESAAADGANIRV